MYDAARAMVCAIRWRRKMTHAAYQNTPPTTHERDVSTMRSAGMTVTYALRWLRLYRNRDCRRNESGGHFQHTLHSAAMFAIFINRWRNYRRWIAHSSGDADACDFSPPRKAYKNPSTGTCVSCGEQPATVAYASCGQEHPPLICIGCEPRNSSCKYCVPVQIYQLINRVTGVSSSYTPYHPGRPPNPLICVRCRSRSATMSFPPCHHHRLVCLSCTLRHNINACPYCRPASH